MNNGARIGWITGLFSFIAYTVLSHADRDLLIQSGEYLKLAQEQPGLSASSSNSWTLLAC